MLDTGLTAKLHDLMDTSQKLQQRSQQCRRQAEELTVRAELLLTEGKLIEECGSLLITNGTNQQTVTKPRHMPPREGQPQR
jgi:hypothetical protein